MYIDTFFSLMSVLGSNLERNKGNLRRNSRLNFSCEIKVEKGKKIELKRAKQKKKDEMKEIESKIFREEFVCFI